MSIERAFLDWARPALPAAADLLIRHYTTGEEVRIDRAIVALPGARAGRRLMELLLVEGAQRGLRLFPPRVTTIGALPELLYEPDRPLADSVLARRVWSRVLRSFEPTRLREVFPRVPERDDLRGWDALARQVERLHRELGGAGLGFGQVVARCGEGLLFDDGARWAVLAQVQDAYLARLRSLGREDRESARLAALQRGALSAVQEVWLAGVVEMPAVVRRMLETSGSPARSLVHAPPELAADFDTAGCVRPSSWLDAEIRIPEGRLRFADRPGDQGDAVVQAIAGLDGQFTADEIAIGVPDEAVVPYLEQRLTAAGLPVRYAAGVPVARTGPFRLLAAVAAFIDGRRHDALAALLRHPDMAHWSRRRDRERFGSARNGKADAWLAGIDRYHRAHLPAHYAGPLAGSGAPRAVVESALRALDADPLLGRLRGRRRLAEWAPEVLGLLVEIYGAEPLDRNQPVERAIVDACEQIRTAAAGFHRLPEAVDEPCDAASAIRLLLAEVESQAIPEEPERAAIEILGWLELHLDDAPVLVVSGLNDGRVPETITADAFLPNAMRARLGLADNDLRYARDAYLLSAMLQSRPEVILLAGRRGAAGDPLRPSRLLFATSPDTVARRVLRFFGDAGDENARVGPRVEHTREEGSERPDEGGERRAESRGRETGDHREEPRNGPGPGWGLSGHGAVDVDGAGPEWGRGRERAEEPAGFVLPPDPELWAPEPISSLRITDFSLLLRDPYRFALERILRLETLDDDAREMDGALFGTLGHAVLGRFGESAEVGRTEAPMIARRLDALLDAEVAQRFGRQALAAVNVQVEQLRARLHAFADWHARWIGAGWHVVATEAAPPDGGVAFDVDGEPVLLRGRIDRLDHNPATGEWAVFDYKTSDAGKEPEAIHRSGPPSGRRWVDLQLPLYRWLALALCDAHGARLIPAGHTAEVRLGYIRLPRDRALTGAAFTSWTPDELTAADEAAREAVRFLRRNRFIFDPERTTIRPEDGLGRLLGLGQLAAAPADVPDRET